MDWLIQYKEWAYGALGAVIVFGITRMIIKKGEPSSQPISGGKSKTHGRDNNNGGSKHHEDY